MIRSSIKNGCKNLHLYPKSFKVTLKPNSYLMSTCRHGQENPSTYTFCSNDLTQTMAYWCSQKVVAYQKNIIETQSDHFMNDLFVFFFYQTVVSTILKAGRSSLNFLFQCVRQVGFGFCKTCSHYNICFK